MSKNRTYYALDFDWLRENMLRLPADCKNKFRESFSGCYIFIRFFNEQHLFKRILHLHSIVEGEVFVPQKSVDDINLFEVLKHLHSFEHFTKLLGRTINNELVLEVNRINTLFDLEKKDKKEKDDPLVNFRPPKWKIELDHSLVMRFCIAPSKMKIGKLKLREMSYIDRCASFPKYDTPIELSLIKQHKYTVQFTKLNEQGWIFDIFLTRRFKKIMQYRFPSSFSMNDIHYINCLTVGKEDFLIFRVIYKEYMYDFIQVYSFMILDLKRRQMYKSAIEEEGTFDNIRDEDGIFQDGKLYYWDQRNSIDVLEFNLEKKDFIKTDKISIDNMCKCYINSIDKFEVCGGFSYKKQSYQLYLTQKKLILLEVYRKRTICFNFDRNFDDLDFDKSEMLCDDTHKVVYFILYMKDEKGERFYFLASLKYRRMAKYFKTMYND